MTKIETTNRFDLQKLAEIKNTAINYWLRLWDETTGGFRFATHQPATLMAEF
jgi:hypothetical protein